jgi:hypothetical protein
MAPRIRLSLRRWNAYTHCLERAWTQAASDVANLSEGKELHRDMIILWKSGGFDMFLGYPDVGAVFGAGHRYECLGLDIQPPFESNSLMRIHARSHTKVTENLRSSCRRREMVNV